MISSAHGFNPVRPVPASEAPGQHASEGGDQRGNLFLNQLPGVVEGLACVGDQSAGIVEVQRVAWVQVNSKKGEIQENPPA